MTPHGPLHGADIFYVFGHRLPASHLLHTTREVMRPDEDGVRAERAQLLGDLGATHDVDRT